MLPFRARQAPAPFLALVALAVLLAWTGWALPAQALVSKAESKEAVTEFTEEAMAELHKPWKGDLDGMVKRGVIRVLVAYSKTNYFVDGANKKGLTYDAMVEFEKQLNKTLLKKGKLANRHLKVHMLLIPVARDKVIPYLLDGKGDLACASLTITSQRKKEVDFSNPIGTDVAEVVVTGPGAPPIKSVEDLSGKTVYVRKSSSYAQSLAKLNKKLKQAGKKPVIIQPASEYLETEDILEMVAAGLIPITVADNYLADFWKQVFKDLKVYDDVTLRTGGAIGWAMRKGSPQLMKAVNRFVAKNKKGTLFGNMLFKRYLQDTKWAKRALSDDSMGRLQQTVELFQKYSYKYGFDWLMIIALAYQESGLDQSKVSPAGAVGVMQLLPSTASGPPVNIPDIKKIDPNIHAGVKYLNWIYKQYFKDQPMNQLNKVLFTFAAYNAGPARVAQLRAKAKAMGLDPNTWFRNVEVAAAKVIGRETVQYVSNIFKYYLAYEQITETERKRQAKKEKLVEKEKLLKKTKP